MAYIVFEIWYENIPHDTKPPGAPGGTPQALVPWAGAWEAGGGAHPATRVDQLPNSDDPWPTGSGLGTATEAQDPLLGDFALQGEKHKC